MVTMEEDVMIIDSNSGLTESMIHGLQGTV